MSRQIMPGTYGVVVNASDTTYVGGVFAEAGQNQNTIIEHYCLYPGYTAPGFDGNGNPIHHLIVKACHLSDLKAGATGTGQNGAVTLGDFFAAMRDLQTSSGYSFTYIQATCVSSTGVPSSP